MVGAQYKDPRQKVVFINDVESTDIETLDEIIVNINSLRYQINKEETPLDFTIYNKIISGDGWYILVKYDGTIESAALNENEDVKIEYNNYLARFIDTKTIDNNESFVKRLKPLSGYRR